MQKRTPEVPGSHGIPVPEAFIQFIDAVLVRARYLFPHLQITSNGSEISIAGDVGEASENVKRQISYLLYREKILAQTAGFRGRMTKYLYEPAK